MTMAPVSHVIVRYTVRPDRVTENEELVRAVYAELAETQPKGLRYVTFALDDGANEDGADDDGVGFVHIAEVSTDDGHNPLAVLEAFARFQDGIQDRVVASPTVTLLRLIGSYQVFGA
jgi:hypothetical protein